MLHNSYKNVYGSRIGDFLLNIQNDPVFALEQIGYSAASDVLSQLLEVPVSFSKYHTCQGVLFGSRYEYIESEGYKVGLFAGGGGGVELRFNKETHIFKKSNTYYQDISRGVVVGLGFNFVFSSFVGIGLRKGTITSSPKVYDTPDGLHHVETYRENYSTKLQLSMDIGSSAVRIPLLPAFSSSIHTCHIISKQDCSPLEIRQNLPLEFLKPIPMHTQPSFDSGVLKADNFISVENGRTENVLSHVQNCDSHKHLFGLRGRKVNTVHAEGTFHEVVSEMSESTNGNIKETTVTKKHAEGGFVDWIIGNYFKKKWNGSWRNWHNVHFKPGEQRNQSLKKLTTETLNVISHLDNTPLAERTISTSTTDPFGENIPCERNEKDFASINYGITEQQPDGTPISTTTDQGRAGTYNSSYQNTITSENSETHIAFEKVGTFIERSQTTTDSLVSERLAKTELSSANEDVVVQKNENDKSFSAIGKTLAKTTIRTLDVPENQIETIYIETMHGVFVERSSFEESIKTDYLNLRNEPTSRHEEVYGNIQTILVDDKIISSECNDWNNHLERENFDSFERHNFGDDKFTTIIATEKHQVTITTEEPWLNIPKTTVEGNALITEVKKGKEQREITNLSTNDLTVQSSRFSVCHKQEELSSETISQDVWSSTMVTKRQEEVYKVDNFTDGTNKKSIISSGITEETRIQNPFKNEIIRKDMNGNLFKDEEMAKPLYSSLTTLAMELVNPPKQQLGIYRFVPTLTSFMAEYAKSRLSSNLGILSIMIKEGIDTSVRSELNGRNILSILLHGSSHLFYQANPNMSTQTQLTPSLIVRSLQTAITCTGTDQKVLPTLGISLCQEATLTCSNYISEFIKNALKNNWKNVPWYVVGAASIASFTLSQFATQKVFSWMTSKFSQNPEQPVDLNAKDRIEYLMKSYNYSGEYNEKAIKAFFRSHFKLVYPIDANDQEKNNRFIRAKKDRDEVTQLLKEVKDEISPKTDIFTLIISYITSRIDFTQLSDTPASAAGEEELKKLEEKYCRENGSGDKFQIFKKLRKLDDKIIEFFFSDDEPNNF